MINILDTETINRIAAGEVIERPSSVVKELVENAIDASSSAITVEIKGGGVDLIRITDNGCGIDKSELKKAFLPHATSKLKSATDLFSISTLGFRGDFYHFERLERDIVGLGKRHDIGDKYSST